MNEISSGAETLPAAWDVDRDETFFRAVADLFPTWFTFGASVLLASYDDETVDVAPTRTDDVPAAAVTAAGPQLLRTNPRRD